MSAGHTPGPWAWHRFAAPADATRKFDVHVTGDGITVARIHGDEAKQPGCCEANARLIAAAPELLARLKEAQVLLLECGATDKTLDSIEAAILRAEGGK